MAGEDSLPQLGARLRDAGLTSRALAAWAGTPRIMALPARLDAICARPTTPADAMLALFVAGAELDAARLRVPPAVLDELAAHGLIERHGERVQARVAIIPLGRALLVCDRIDAPVRRDRVSWPDDSSHHLATALPGGRRARWLDLACGSAYAPLARPELGSQIAAADLNERAVRYAALGARLSGIAHLACTAGDIGDVQPPADLVTCNAPIPAAAADALVGGNAPIPAGPADAHDRRERMTRDAPIPAAPADEPAPELWRHAGPAFFDRLWPALRAAVRPGGMIVLHAAREALAPALRDAAGERVVVTYTPDDVRAFAIAWWRPDAPARFAALARPLTVDRPYVDPADREAALAAS